ncbi:hypothetical protein [Sulfitobacter sp. JB4-11]|uniref:hypothetical protein n=1 Tax=Sulfitobacter rhodophyticola TaxID=3238304 RepID=UPI003519893F
MKDRNYTRSIQVSASPAASFAAITSGVEHWWTKPDRTIRAVGDRAKFRFPPRQSYWTFEAVELKPNAFVKLKCIDALHMLEGFSDTVQTEWLGTSTHWRISAERSGSRIEFTHDGLHPGLQCFDICQAGWDMFFVGSLKAYLDTGQGNPHVSSR